MFEVRLDKQPARFLKDCESDLYARIVSKLKELESNPVPHDAKRLRGYELPTFRIRIGKYRALYRISYEAKLVVVVKIDKRSRLIDHGPGTALFIKPANFPCCQARSLKCLGNAYS